MAVILEITSTPQNFAAGTWPATAMNTAAWRFSFTPTTAMPSGYAALFTDYGAGSGGLWLNGNSIELYSSAAALLVARSLTASGGQTVTITLDPVADTLTIAGATTGNGTFSATNAAAYIDGSAQLCTGNNAGTYLFAGTISSVEDVGAAGIDGTGATVLTELAVAASGSLAIEASAAASADLTASAVGAIAIDGVSAAETPSLVVVGDSPSVVGTSAVTLAEPAVAASGALTIAGTSAVTLAELIASAAEPATYTLAPFESFPAYPSGQQTRTNVWAYGAPMILRDSVSGAIVCPVASANDQLYLLVSDDRGQTWRFVSRNGGGTDPIYDQHVLYSFVQDSTGACHLLSGDGGSGVAYSRLTLDRDGSDVITGYTRATDALAVFGGLATEHVAMLTVVRDQSGDECLMASMQAAPGGQMAVYAAKTLTITPASAADFTRLDGTSGYTTLISGLAHNDHEHVSYHSYLSATGDVVFFRAHKPAEGFQTGTGYAQVYHLRAQQDGAHTWSLGSWQAYEAGQGVHLRGVCQSASDVYLIASYQTDGVSIDRWTGGTYTKSAIAAPTTLYSPNSFIDGAIACSSDGSRVFVYIGTYLDEDNRSGYFACYEGGAWTKSAPQNPPWQCYSASTSTGDDYGIYAVRADGPYKDTTPTIGGFYVSDPGIGATAAAALSEPTVVAAGTLTIAGTAALALAELQVETGGQVGGTSALLLAELTAAASGELSLTGTGAASLDELAATSAGALSISGTAAATLAELVTLAGADTVLPNNGTAAATLDECTAAASGALSIGGTGALDLGELAVASSGSIAFVGTAAASLDALTASAETFLGGITGTSASEVLLYVRASDGSRRAMSIGGVLAARGRVRRGRAR